MKRFGVSSDSILVRTGGILLVGMVVSVILSNLFFAVQRSDAFRSVQLSDAAEHLVTLVSFMESSKPEVRAQLLHDFKASNMQIEFGAAPMVSGKGHSVEARLLDNFLSVGLPFYDVRVMRVVPTPPKSADKSGDMGMHADGDIALTLWLSIGLNDGTWLNGYVHLMPSNPPLWRPRTLLRLVVALSVLALVALWAVWRIARPFNQFAEAADRLGRNVAAPGMVEEGPLEFRQAARAFNLMRERIGRFVQDRTQMVAAISHDLRTPITRLRLRVEFVDDDTERARMVADLDEMERMISATLTFAHDSSAKVERRAVDLASLLQGISEDYAELGNDVTFIGPDNLVVNINAVSIKRAISNLIENAVKYGNCAIVCLERQGDDAVIRIKDKGPGIDPADRERVFSPFFRLEESRNRATGGSGLGLSIARAAIRAHGGDIILSNASEQLEDEHAHGLWATVTIPC